VVQKDWKIIFVYMDGKNVEPVPLVFMNVLH